MKLYTPWLAASAATLALLAACLLPAPAARAADGAVHGAGATFPAKVYAQWAQRHSQEIGAPVRYDAIGSSAGVRAIQDGKVDFGATDVPVAPAELQRRGLVQFPTLVGGVVPVVNLPGVPSGRLRLGPEVLAAILAGRIERWNDPAIAALNPQLRLPALPIVRVVRADGSGTTEVLVRYLKQAAPEQAAAIALKGGIADWPGQRVQPQEGSSRLGEAVKATPGALGYVSSDYVLRDKLAAVSLRNRRGEWVVPDLASLRATLRSGGVFQGGPDSPAALDVDAAGAWPLVTATYILVPAAPKDLARAARTLNFFYQSFMMGDRAVANSGFSPLPIDMQARIVGRLSGLRTPDGTLVLMGGR